MTHSSPSGYDFAGFGLDYRKFDATEPHAAPRFLHVREPDVVLECPLAQADQCKNFNRPH